MYYIDHAIKYGLKKGRSIIVGLINQNIERLENKDQKLALWKKI